MTANYDAKRLQMTYMSVHAASNVNDKIVSLDYNFYNGGANNGRIPKLTNYLDQSFTQTYTYDDQNRLTQDTSPAFTRSYNYDAWANLTGVTATGAGEVGSYSLSYATNATGAPSTNRINNAGQSYDNAGNMTVDMNGHVFNYDAANRIKNVTGNKFMEYDGDGHRVLSDEAAIGNTKFWYLWSSVLGQPMAEITSAGGVYRAYVYNPGGGLVAQQGYDGGFQWVQQDHLGGGYRMTDVNGAVVFTEQYDPHGQTVLRTAPNGPWYLSKKFTGYERDYGTNTDNAMARQYHHNNGRFMQADPLGLDASDLENPQSLNLYSYVQNDPVNFVDPSGTNLCYGFNILISNDGGSTWTNIGFITVYCDSGSSGNGSSGGGESSGGSGDGSDAQNKIGDKVVPNPCAVMAQIAGMFANYALKKNTSKTLGVEFTNYGAALNEFDTLFGGFYAGGTMQTYRSAKRMSDVGALEATRPNALTGEGDFRKEFQNERTPGDQTHHFAAHLSSGINGTRLSSAFHAYEDDDNGDRRLTLAAYLLGGDLSKTRGRGLASIEKAIKQDICK